MTPAEFAQRLVDNVATATQLDPEKGELPNVDDWRRNAEKLFAFATGATEPRPMPAYLASFPQGPVAPDPDPSPEPRKCPVCLAITYRDDGIAYCTDHEPQLSERARKALAALSLAEPRDFARLKWIDLLRVDGCGTKTRAELLAWAGEHGAHLIHRLPKREREVLVSKEPAQ